MVVTSWKRIFSVLGPNQSERSEKQPPIMEGAGGEVVSYLSKFFLSIVFVAVLLFKMLAFRGV